MISCVVILQNRRTVYMLSSNSSLSLHSEQKSEQKLTPDNTRQKFLDSTEPKMERSLPSVRVSTGQSEEKAKVMVCELEKVVESHHQDTKEKTIEMMGVEHNEDEKEIDDNRCLEKFMCYYQNRTYLRYQKLNK